MIAGISGTTIAPGLRVPLRHGLAARPAKTATIRVLTGADEAALGAALAGGPAGEHWVTRVLATVVEDLGGSRPEPAELRALSVGDRNALLLGAVAGTYGALVEWVLDCPSCGERLDAGVDLAELVADAGAGEGAALGAAAPVAGFRLPNGADLEAVAELSPPGAAGWAPQPGGETGVDTETAAATDADPADATTTADPAEWARRLLLDRCVTAWRELDEGTLAAIESAMAAADPLADIELLLGCAACGTAVPAVLDPAAELAARLSPYRLLMADVHALALAYGWTEPEVLALPAPRRAGYLTLVADGEL
ncbi:hypothetical protein ACWEQL_05835 [Kitasatospora sp. NPDC004240]